MVTVITKSLERYLTHLTTAEIRIAGASYYWVRRITEYAERRMKENIRPKSRRGKGTLRQSIKSKVTTSAKGITGIAYVPESIKHQFYVEYGSINRKTIRSASKSAMSFPISSWENSAGWQINKFATKSGKSMGYYIFRKVRRGVYKGMGFTRKAFVETKTYINHQSRHIMDDIGNIILARTSVR